MVAYIIVMEIHNISQYKYNTPCFCTLVECMETGSETACMQIKSWHTRLFLGNYVLGTAIPVQCVGSASDTCRLCYPLHGHCYLWAAAIHLDNTGTVVLTLSSAWGVLVTPAGCATLFTGTATSGQPLYTWTILVR